MAKVYIIGSMANAKIPFIGKELRAAGHEVVDDWFSPGDEADVRWREYELIRGRTFAEALNGIHAKFVFGIDKHWLDWADTAILVRPAGKSGHLELGYMVGQGKRAFVLLEEPDPERWDIMYRFAHGVTADLDELNGWL